MTQHTPAIEDRFAAYQETDAPADLRRRLVAAIKSVDPVVQLDATGCVLAGVLMDEHRLREINAELLAALQWAFDCWASGAWLNEDGQTPDIEPVRAAIARAEGEDR